ncbi:MAG: tetratricopeptide repeat protein [Gallionellaceae bacterium]|jgi:hypothetical protein
MWLVRYIKGIFKKPVIEPFHYPQCPAAPTLEQVEQSHFARLQQDAINGDLDAQLILGFKHEMKGWKNDDDPLDYFRARGWYTRAAEQGYADAQYFLACLYKKGLGIPPDNEKAAYWFRKAAEQGHSSAQYSLHISYRYGEGVPQNDDIAEYWLHKSNEPPTKTH